MTQAKAVVDECKRQEENCQYTAASLYVWQKYARAWRALFLIVPIILSGFATSEILGKYLGLWGQIAAAAAGVVAGIFPAIFVALNMDMKVVEIGRAAAEFTNLRDRFRQLGNITSQGSPEDLPVALESLMDRLDAVRTTSPPVPEWCFKKAQAKVSKGDYAFEVDKSRRQA